MQLIVYELMLSELVTQYRNNDIAYESNKIYGEFSSNYFCRNARNLVPSTGWSLY